MADHLDAPTIYRLGQPVLGVPVLGVSYQSAIDGYDLPEETTVFPSPLAIHPTLSTTAIDAVPLPDPLVVLQQQLDALTLRVARLERPWYARAWAAFRRWVRSA